MRFSRRKVVMALGGGIGAVIFGGVGSLAFWLRAQDAQEGFKVLSLDESKLIDAYAEAYFPPDNALGLDVRSLNLPSAVDAHFAQLPDTEQRLARLLLGVFDNWPRVSFVSGRRFASLPLAERADILDRFDASSLPERRGVNELLRGIVGLHIFESESARKAVGHNFGCAIGGPT